jgi:hypothetical protein
VNDHPQLNLKGGTFTKYPSQSGAYFQWSVAPAQEATYARRAYHPTNPGGAISNWNASLDAPGFWTSVTNNHESISELCPEGYRRANDGSTSVGVMPIITGLSQSNNNVYNSELRQSLWLNPQTGGSSNLNNNIYGYYADGFFDRREITGIRAGATGSDSPVYAVSNTNSDIACIGRLFYNPHTATSLFFPGAGQRNFESGTVYDPGVYGYYWSSSNNHLSNAWTLAMTISTANDLLYMLGAYRASARSIRCVLGEPPPQPPSPGSKVREGIIMNNEK